MKIHITARHTRLRPAMSAYLTKKINRLERHYDHLVWANAILSVEKHRQSAEIVIHSPLHTIRAKAESLNLYESIDLAVDKADRQLKKLKEKWKESGRRQARAVREESMIYLPAHSLSMSALEDLQGGRQSDSFSMPSMISVVKQVPIKPMSVIQAIQSMESLGYNFWMFLNRATKKYNVLFRRTDQTYGLMEPSRK